MDNHKQSYWRFAAMIGTSVVAMFGLMYLHTYEFSHVRWSETRFFMTLIMGAAMAIIMLSFMLGMYKNSKINLGIFAGSALLFVLALFLVRSQTTIQDRSWMSAMIPHHSIAILTSERAEIEDVRVGQLADDIILAQRREILEMNWLIEDIKKNGVAKTQAEAQARAVPEFEVSLSPASTEGSQEAENE